MCSTYVPCTCVCAAGWGGPGRLPVTAQCGDPVAGEGSLGTAACPTCGGGGGGGGSKTVSLGFMTVSLTVLIAVVTGVGGCCLIGCCCWSCCRCGPRVAAPGRHGSSACALRRRPKDRGGAHDAADARDRRGPPRNDRRGGGDRRAPDSEEAFEDAERGGGARYDERERDPRRRDDRSWERAREGRVRAALRRLSSFGAARPDRRGERPGEAGRGGGGGGAAPPDPRRRESIIVRLLAMLAGAEAARDAATAAAGAAAPQAGAPRASKEPEETANVV